MGSSPPARQAGQPLQRQQRRSL